MKLDPDKQPGSEPVAGGSILVVDDSQLNLRLLSQVLGKRGHQVYTALSGPQAIEAAQANPPDLILLDIMMPEMDGFQVCARLKADARTCHIPVLFISALDSTSNKVKALTMGGVDYITKPFQNEEVVARVQTHLVLLGLRKQLQSANQEMARQMEELHARNEELDAFAQAIANDLKTPLTSIIGFADMLKNLRTSLPGEELDKSLDAIAANGRKMDAIIEKLLLLAKVRQTGQVEISQLDTSRLVNTALKRLADVIQEHQAKISLPATWPLAWGYALWVEQVWVNAISAAIGRAGQPPHIELGAKYQEDGLVCFWVRDNGPSAEPDETRPAKKIGLGQFIVQRIAQQLGLQTGGDSQGQPGEGNLFTFTLPGSRPEGGDQVAPF